MKRSPSATWIVAAAVALLGSAVFAGEKKPGRARTASKASSRGPDAGADARADTRADAAYEAARDAYRELRKDEARRRFRHHWLNVAKKLEQVASKFPRSERAPEALFNSGELFNELSRFSGSDEDVEAAEAAYERLLDGWPRHRLADDAGLSWARLLADRQGQPAKAREVLGRALEQANDRKKELKALLASLDEDARRRGGGGRKTQRGARNDETEDDAVEAPSRARGGAPNPPGEGQMKAARARDATDDAQPKAGPDDGHAKAGSRADEAQAKAAPRADKDQAKAAHTAIARAEQPAAQPDGRGGALAEAIRRTGRAVESAKLDLSGLAPSVVAHAGVPPPPAEDAQGRRLPPPRPREAEATHGSDDVDEAHSASAIAGLQERLRDVRVGAQKPDEAAKARFKTLARAEGSAELSLAQQLGLKVRRVVIDAGHGGHDTGAIGPRGTREKDIALHIAQKLAARLEEAGLEVVQTREDDTFVKLEDRTMIANREKGDLFISVHCNAAPSKALRGIETYTLNTSSNRYSIRLAARENATSERGVGDLQYILADLATKANTGESTRLALRVQKSLVENLSGKFKDVRDLGHKEALFFVLLGARMPSILVETSFLSNPDEETRLASDDYQTQVADSIAEAVSGFLDEREKQLAALE